MLLDYRSQREGKVAEQNGQQELCNSNRHRLYCETVACDCPAATSSDVPAYTAPGDVTSYRTCYARRPKVGGAEHAHEAGTVLTLRCEEIEASGASVACGCCHDIVVDAQPVDVSNYAADADGTQLDLLCRDVAAASASII